MLLTNGRVYTLDVADRVVGTLEPGKRADLVVLSQDVFPRAESRIAAIRPVLTLVGGRVAFRDPVGAP